MSAMRGKKWRCVDRIIS